MIANLKTLGWAALALGGAAFVFWVLVEIATALDWLTFRRTFYTVAPMVVVFYVARAVRAVAKYFEAKARKEAR